MEDKVREELEWSAARLLGVDDLTNNYMMEDTVSASAAVWALRRIIEIAYARGVAEATPDEPDETGR